MGSDRVEAITLCLDIILCDVERLRMLQKQEFKGSRVIQIAALLRMSHRINKLLK